MGYRQHHALIIIGLQDEPGGEECIQAIEDVRSNLSGQAAAYFVGPIPGASGFVTYALLPDGVGRHHAAEVDADREALLRAATSHPFTKAIHVSFGDEGSQMTRVEATTDRGVVGQDTTDDRRGLRPGEYARKLNWYRELVDPLLVEFYITTFQWYDILAYSSVSRVLTSSHLDGMPTRTAENLEEVRKQSGIDRQIEIRVTPHHLGGGFLIGREPGDRVAVLGGDYEDHSFRSRRYADLSGSAADAIRNSFMSLWETAEPFPI